MENPDTTLYDESDPSKTQRIEFSDKKGLVAILVIIEGENFGKQFPIEKNITTIGRQKQCDLIIDDGKTSREHFLIQRDDKSSECIYTIKDLRSMNGTFLNGSPVTESRLENGDKILAGKTLLGFFLKDPVDMKFDSKIMNLAIHDGLTGLYNRLFLNQVLHNEFYRAKRYGKPLSVLFIDIDLFKKVNDTFGHAVGDEVLKELSVIISDTIRTHDVAARYGGEEFVVILPETDLNESVVAAHRIRKQMGKTAFDSVKGKFNVTVSVGVATLEKSMKNEDQLISLADKNLYKAKDDGRNKVYPI